MSGIARVLLDMGYHISGSDVEPNEITKTLEEAGAKICRGHRGSNLPRETEALVYSSSISADNPEIKEAGLRKIRVMHRAEMLGELFNDKIGIAITGTHGKTTTTSLVSVMLKESGFSPTVVIGGKVDSFKGNAAMGSGEHMVAEADESDSSFLHLKPFYTVITNIEMEHLDHFKTLNRIKAAYKSFIENTKKGGVVFYNIDDENLKKVVNGFGKKYNTRFRSFGLLPNADIYPRNIKMDGFNTSFDCIYAGKKIGKVFIRIPGIHNVVNALASILVGLELGLKFSQISSAIKDFNGAGRRFELKADSGGIMLIDDYAHHPTEIRAVLKASRNWKDKRRIVIFQPHRYSRTKFFAGLFGKAFEGADKLILTDIYAASEKAIPGVSIRSVYDSVRQNGLEDVTILEKEKIADYVMKIASSGDMVIVMGAGDIKKVADELCEKLKKVDSGEWIVDGRLEKIVRGEIKRNEPLSSHTSFKIGGAADVWFEPVDVKDLKKAVMFAKRNKIPFFVIGNGSNILAKDAGFAGILIHPGADYFKKVRFTGNKIRVGAGFSLPKLVNLACHKGLAGLESLVGIPGMIGGAVYMNAGGWTNPIFRNIGELVCSLKVMDKNGNVKILRKDDIKFGYRSSNLERYIILEAVLKLTRGDTDALVSSASGFLKMKREKQVLDTPSAGCVFKNPADSQFTCGQMIDMLGLKGSACGGAEISPRHANFIVNKSGATCKDVLSLVELVKNKVKESYDIDLEMEIKLV